MLVASKNYNEEIEKNILSLFLKDNKLFKIHAGSLKEKDFYSRRHQLIFRGIQLLVEQDYQVDIIIIGNLFESKGKLEEIGGRSNLVSLVGLLPPASHLKSYIKELKKFSKLRKEEELNLKLAQAIDSQNQEQIISLKEQLINVEKDYLEVKPQVLTAWMKDFERNYNDPDEGIPTPFPSLNRSINGFQKGELISLTGMSGTGKSILALQFAIEAVKKNFKTLFFSLEMSANQMIPRFLSIVMGIDIHDIKFKKLDYEAQIKDNLFELDKFPIKFAFEMLTTNQIYSISYLEKLSKGLDFIIVDYFSLLQDSGFKSEIEKEKEVIGRLKNLAKKLEVVVFVPTALSKEVAKRKKGGATAEDVIGSIHQTYTVDIAIALERKRTSSDGKISITKNRSGDYCSFPVFFDQRYLTFGEVDQHHDEPPPPEKERRDFS